MRSGSYVWAINRGRTPRAHHQMKCKEREQPLVRAPPRGQKDPPLDEYTVLAALVAEDTTGFGQKAHEGSGPGP